MRTYQVGFSVRVTSDDEISGHRLEIPVEAESAEVAAKIFGETLASLLAPKPFKESKAK